MDDRRFDALARSAGTAPRRRVLGAALAAAFGGFAGVIDAAETDAACKGNFCSGKRRHCHRKKHKHCFCYKRVGGGHYCGANDGSCPETGCAADADCPEGAVCIKSGRRCCPGQATGCVFPCAEIPLVADASKTSEARWAAARRASDAR